MTNLSWLYQLGTDRTENTVPLLLFTSRCLVTAVCCDSTILALSEYTTFRTINFLCLLPYSTPVVYVNDWSKYKNQYEALIRSEAYVSVSEL
jgi:hypothetical protein